MILGSEKTGRNLFRRSGTGWHGLGWSYVKTGIIVVIGISTSQLTSIFEDEPSKTRQFEIK